MQGLHRQILPWTDDVEHRVRAVRAARALRPAARRAPRAAAEPAPATSVADDYDEGEILASLVAGLGGAFLGEERAAVEELRAAGPPAGSTLLEAYQERRMELLAARGFDVSGLAPELMTSADDVFCFPNVVGPIYPGQCDPLPRAAERARSRLARSRTRGCSSGRAPGDASGAMPSAEVLSRTGATATGARSPSRTTRTSRNVQRGMRSRGLDRRAAEPAPGGQHPAHAPRDRPLPRRRTPRRRLDRD